MLFLSCSKQRDVSLLPKSKGLMKPILGTPHLSKPHRYHPGRAGTWILIPFLSITYRSLQRSAHCVCKQTSVCTKPFAHARYVKNDTPDNIDTLCCQNNKKTQSKSQVINTKKTIVVTYRPKTHTNTPALRGQSKSHCALIYIVLIASKWSVLTVFI